MEPSRLIQRARQTRRGFLTAGAGLAATGIVDLAGFPSRRARAVEPGRARTVSIFHSTDLHGRILPTRTYEGLEDVGGFARVATCLRRWRKECPHSLTVDVGDVVQGTAVSKRSEGRLMIDLFNHLGYDAWTLGNHDFDWGPERTEALLQASACPVLTANLARGGTVAGGFDGAWAKVKPWTIREVGGFRIGLIGLITPGLPFWLPPEMLAGTTPLDPAAVLAATVREVRAEGVDAVVVMGHMGWRFNDDYANPVRAVLKDVRGVDVYLAGHSHQNQPAWMMHDVLCSQASYFGIHCGRVDLTFDLASRKLVDRRAFTILMDDRFEPDPLVMQVAAGDLAAAETELAREVATVTRPIAGKGRGCPLAKLLCDCFAGVLADRGMPVDAVFHGTFGTGDLPARRLTVGDCWRIIPYENTLVTADVTPAELALILEEDATIRDSDRTLWPLEATLDADGRVRRIALDGEDVKADRRLRIAMNSYDAQSGGRRLLKTQAILETPAALRTSTFVDTRDALVAGLVARGDVG
ncbi:MAG: bifunctional metallophosphatase/5'-nucleotidase [Planctomycetes bacterium]|nr:bifunctional metallophosphatase/5'-nucleotidase [Planctomycetota bacterium]